MIRSRYTLLDLRVETGTIGELVESLFEPDGFWGRRPWPQDWVPGRRRVGLTTRPSTT